MILFSVNQAVVGVSLNYEGGLAIISQHRVSDLRRKLPEANHNDASPTLYLVGVLGSVEGRDGAGGGDGGGAGAEAEPLC